MLKNANHKCNSPIIHLAKTQTFRYTLSMYLLIDVGGTKTLLAIANPKGKILHSIKFPTIHDQNNFAKNLVQQIRSNFALGSIEAIGVALPGVVKDNKVQWLGNLPWKNFDLAKILKDEFGIPAYIENDANLAALAEAKNKTGRTLYLTFSTGIGGGVVDDNVLSKKFQDFEPGHTIYEYNGEKSEWEDLASAKAFVDQYGIKVQDIKDKKCWSKEIPERIALGLAPVITETKPDRIVFGGPLGFELKRYRTPLRRILKNELNTKTLPRFTAAKYGNFSVIEGCFLYAKANSTTK